MTDKEDTAGAKYMWKNMPMFTKDFKEFKYVIEEEEVIIHGKNSSSHRYVIVGCDDE